MPMSGPPPSRVPMAAGLGPSSPPPQTTRHVPSATLVHVSAVSTAGAVVVPMPQVAAAVNNYADDDGEEL